MTQAPPAVPELDALIEAADYVIDSYMRLWRGQVVRDVAEAEEAYSAAKDAAFGARHRTQALTAGAGDYVLVPRDLTDAMLEAGRKESRLWLSPSENIAPIWEAILQVAAPAPQNADVADARKKLTPEYLAMTPRQKWEALTLHGLLGTDEPWIADMRETLRQFDAPQPTSELEGEYERGMRKAAEICGALAETTYDDADGFAAATGCEASILAALRHGEQSHG